MASPSLNLIILTPSVASSTKSPSARCYCSGFQPALAPRSSFSSALSDCVCIDVIRNGRTRRRSHIVRMAPEEEKMTRRSPLDFPIEWERPKPGRRPDVFPQFSPMKTPLPPPLPADPPEEDEEEEEKKEEEEEDPDKEADPEQPEKQ